ncbi:protein PSK SIMULATOR 3-like [Hibiscus syriacus]|uniref:protein PSK SIMULATOR 3-like n=1 Tax=Hibiscus syriacus TaxID=106335 RepID=UPI0019248212|nr:protein PSK SIMULATOR 3-like [Hibiscus syriacus]
MASVDATNDFESINSDCLSRSHSFSTIIPSSVYPSDHNLCGFSSGPLGRSFSKSMKCQTNSKHLKSHYHSTSLHGKLLNSRTKQAGHVAFGPFKGCMSAGSVSPVLESCKPIGSASMRFSGAYTKKIDKINNSKMETLSGSHNIYSKLSFFNTKRLLNAPTSTLGGAALSLRYANLIILIEKLVLSPHLISVDARDDLYSMLPTTMRNALRIKLKPYAKTLASSIYDASLAAEWSLALVRILEWLAPLAHNMIRWQSDHNFEEQQLVSRSNVLLVQTLHFADQAKTEAAITELLVGLNYFYRIGKAHNEKALPESADSGCTQYSLKGDDTI